MAFIHSSPKNTPEQTTVQIWNSFGNGTGGVPVRDVPNPDLLITIDEAPQLPQEIEAIVAASWNAAKEKNPKLKDNSTTYFAGEPQITSEGITVPTVARGFRYTFAYNRDKENHNRVEELNQYKLLTLSQHTHIITADGKIMFGVKINQGNQISGFSGFPNVDEDSTAYTGRRVIDLKALTNNRLLSEIGKLTDSIKDIHATGITYVGTPGLRGTDANYLIVLEETAANIERTFKESDQFKKDLFFVEWNPETLAQFFIERTDKGDKISRYALGASFNNIRAVFGEDEASKYLGKVRTLLARTDESIAIGNKTAYFPLNNR